MAIYSIPRDFWGFMDDKLEYTLQFSDTIDSEDELTEKINRFKVLGYNIGEFEYNREVEKEYKEEIRTEEEVAADIKHYKDYDVDNGKTYVAYSLDNSYIEVFCLGRIKFPKYASDLFKQTKFREVDFTNANLSYTIDFTESFRFCKKLRYVNFSNLDMNRLVYALSLFGECGQLEEVDISGTSLERLAILNWTFSKCKKLRKIVLDTNTYIGKQIDDISYLFYDCGELESIDLTKLWLGNVTTVQNAFAHCHKLKSLDFSKSGLNKISSIDELFYYCSSLESVDFTNTNFDLVKEVLADSVFNRCLSLKEVKGLNIKSDSIFDKVINTIQYNIKLRERLKAERVLALNNKEEQQENKEEQ